MNRTYRILYVDDEECLLEICKAFLERSNSITVDTALSVMEAQRMLIETDYDAIISDYQMPGMNGIDLLRAVRSSGNRIPFILFTGKGREEVIIDALISGASSYLQKGGDPVFQFAELEHRLRQTITQHRSEVYLTKMSALKLELLGHGGLDTKLKIITDAAVQIFGADLARVWIIKNGDICSVGCPIADAPDLPRTCLERPQCLHLVASSGLYTHIDGGHRRVPIGMYKIGLVATGEVSKFVINDVVNDPLVHDHKWAERLGLISFAGYRLISREGKTIGVLALFRSSKITAEEELLLEDLADTTSHVMIGGMAEEALQASEDKFRTIFNHVNDAIFIHYVGGAFIEVNDAACKRLGYSKEELMTLKPQDINAPEFVSMLPNRTREVLEKESIVYGTIHLTKQGDRIPTEMSVRTLTYKGGTAVLAIARDITERMTIEEGLSKANEKLALLNNITRHDMSNQIMIVKGNLTLLKKQTSDPSILSRLERIELSVEALSSQLKFTKDYQGVGATLPQWQKLMEFLRDPLQYIELDGLEFSDKAQHLEIFADLMLGKVLNNLVENTIKYAGRPATVSIDCHETELGLVITYQDDGNGIPAEEKEKIFEKGYGKGTGLGLFLSREILAITGMTIEETGVPGMGARFEVLVPKGKYRFFHDP